ncbi:hypothetical protein M2281_003851 [Mesorhizobium soli]|uniref:hypothetical protein n=1 Tax=Pseudaminobacter soli (ex Li et al. 2025) TaxID=1295366 RepID=UPI0024742BDF|nr:hypothetical protein [Mesorhizobium soli]MDH6233240.1 hypothetical protein [Mesorhizobium soli]
MVLPKFVQALKSRRKPGMANVWHPPFIERFGPSGLFSGGAVLSGAAIVDGTVYWGSGYHTKILGLPYAGDSHKLYAFSVAKP